MSNVSKIDSLGYVRIGMQEPAQWAEVGESLLGLSANTSSKALVRLAMDTAPSRFIVESAAQDGFVCAGWEVAASRYASVQADLVAAGVSLTQGDAQGCALRQVAAFCQGSDPSGNLFEIYHTRERGAQFRSSIAGVSFVADNLGLGHVVLPAAQHAATSAFYQQVLHFGMSDELTLPPPVPDMPDMVIHFLHANSPRHHSLGLFNGPAPSGVVHLMLELTTLDAVGACLDRVTAAGLPITATLGRHANDGMVSFYFLAPGGIPVEVGFDGQQFDWQDFTPTQSTVGDLWGHAYSFPE